VTFSREDSHFFTQITGQPRIEIFATARREFFLKAVDAQVTFEVDANGRATTVVLHQAGRDMRAPRVE
jgi:hypothetical protein